MKKTLFALGTFALGITSFSALGYIPESYGIASSTGVPSNEISAYVDVTVSTASDIQDLATLAGGYMDMASDYAELACDEAEAAEEARNSGDYEGFQEHLEASQEASELAQAAADAAASYAESARELADAATSSGTGTTGSGIDFEVGWWSDTGLGNTYEVDDISTIWDMMPRWSAEDLMGIYTDPTWGMENIPTDWDYDLYLDPDFWTGTEVFVEEFYGTDNNEDYYTEAINFYEGILTGDDLTQFETNADYHDYLVNVYVNAFLETGAYQAAVADTYAQGNLSFDAFETNIQGQVDGFFSSGMSTTDLNVTDTMINQSVVNQSVTQTMQTIYNFR